MFLRWVWRRRHERIQRELKKNEPEFRDVFLRTCKDFTHYMVECGASFEKGFNDLMVGFARENVNVKISLHWDLTFVENDKTFMRMLYNNAKKHLEKSDSEAYPAAE